MTRKGKGHSRRLEQLIKFVNKEQEAGQLTEDQVKLIAKASLKPLEEQKNSLAYFMLGGGINEKVAKDCCDILIEQLKQYLPENAHVLSVIAEMQSLRQTERQ